MRIELEHRRRLYDVPDAKVVCLAANAYEVTLPRDADAVQRARRPWTLEGWDDAVLVLDGVDGESAVASRIDARQVTLTVLLP